MSQNIAPIWQGQIAPRNDQPRQADRSDLFELLLAWRRQKWLVVFFACAGLAVGAVHYVTSPKEYYSSTTILIEERQNDLDQEISSLRPLSRNETSFENQMQILQSTQLATEVVRRLGLQDNPDFLSPPRSALGVLKSSVLQWVRSVAPQPERTGSITTSTPDEIARDKVQRAASRLAQETLFFRAGKSFSVEIGYLSSDPELAAAIADAYAEAYLADGMLANTETNDRTAAWMQERIEGLRQAALDAATEAEKFRAQNGAMDQQGLREREQRVEALNALYLTIEAQYQETLIAGSYPVANGRVLADALVADRPVEPKAWRILLAGLIVGTMAGLGLAILRERRETGYRTAHDVTVAGLDFLGYLPFIDATERQVARNSGKSGGDKPNPAPSYFASSRSPYAGVPGRAGGLTAAAPLLLEEPLTIEFAAPELMISIEGKATGYQLAVRNILASIELGLDEGRGHVIAIGGLVEGEGATTLAANLANLAAITGRRVLLVDGDLGRSDLTGRMELDGAEDRGGPYDRSTSKLRSVRTLSASGLDFLPAFDSEKSRTEASRVVTLRQALASARESYDLVFVDLPPLCHRPEAKAWLRLLDGIVLVVDWGKTSHTMCQEYLAREPDLRKQILGVVLNRTKTHRLWRYGVVPASNRSATL